MNTPQGTQQGRHIAIYGSDQRRPKRWELSINPDNPNDIKALKLAVKHPSKHCFPRMKPLNVVLGDWDNDIVKIDFDQQFLCQVKRYSRMLMERSNLGGFIILESSSRMRHVLDEQLGKVVYKYKNKSYHVVFDEVVSYGKIISCLSWLCMAVKDQKLTDWFLMQFIKAPFT